jgi:FHS family Na+ dependent glucose MFS transporter 1
VLDVGANTLLVWMYGHKVSPFMNGLHFFFGVGAFLSPIIVAQAILISGDIVWAYWILALLILPVALWLVRLPSPISKTNAGDSLSEPINYLLVGMIALFLFLYVGAEVAFGGWIFTYVVALGLTNETTAAYLTSAFWGSFTLGRLLSIPVAVWVKPGLVLLGDLGGCLIGIGTIFLWPDSLTAIWLGTFGLGFSMASIFPTTISFAERRLTITGQVTGWLFVGASGGAMFLPWLIGQLFEPVGAQATMLIIMVDLIVAMGIFAIMIRKL